MEITTDAALTVTIAVVRFILLPTNSQLIMLKCVFGRLTKQGTFLVRSLGSAYKVRRQFLSSNDPELIRIMVFIAGSSFMSLRHLTLGLL